MAAHRRMVLERCSGTLCVDDLHPGRAALLVTDPPVTFALVDKDDADHMRRFLEDLKARGLMPRVVVTDGSNLYPELLAKLWPEANHQLCVLHAIKAINDLILDAARRVKAADELVGIGEESGSSQTWPKPGRDYADYFVSDCRPEGRGCGV